jgi:hypothetical protein
MTLPPDILDELRKDYLNSLPDIILEIKTALEDGDWDIIEKHFHRFAGSGQTYGLPDITTVGRGIEGYLLKNPDEPSPVLLAEAISIFEKIVENYRAGVKTSDSAKDKILKKIG